MTRADLPPVTDAHRRQAYAAMRVPMLPYEEAMRLEVWRKVIECAAHKLRTSQWQARQRAQQDAAAQRAEADLFNSQGAAL